MEIIILAVSIVVAAMSIDMAILAFNKKNYFAFGIGLVAAAYFCTNIMCFSWLASAAIYA